MAGGGEEDVDEEGGGTGEGLGVCGEYLLERGHMGMC